MELDNNSNTAVETPEFDVTAGVNIDPPNAAPKAETKQSQPAKQGRGYSDAEARAIFDKIESAVNPPDGEGMSYVQAIKNAGISRTTFQNWKIKFSGGPISTKAKSSAKRLAGPTGRLAAKAKPGPKRKAVAKAPVKTAEKSSVKLTKSGKPDGRSARKGQKRRTRTKNVTVAPVNETGFRAPGIASLLEQQLPAEVQIPAEQIIGEQCIEIRQLRLKIQVLEAQLSFSRTANKV